MNTAVHCKTKEERCKKEGHAWADNGECGCCGIKVAEEKIKEGEKDCK